MSDRTFAGLLTGKNSRTKSRGQIAGRVVRASFKVQAGAGDIAAVGRQGAHQPALPKEGAGSQQAGNLISLFFSRRDFPGPTCPPGRAPTLLDGPPLSALSSACLISYQVIYTESLGISCRNMPL